MADQMVEFTQINLHHCKEASAELYTRLCKMHTGVALVQEPWLVKNRIRGLGFPGATILYDISCDRPRAAIVLTKGVKHCVLPNLTTQDTVAVQLETEHEGEYKSVIVASVYLPYDSVDMPPSREMEALVDYARGRGLSLLVGCDSNAHHASWGSTGTNQRGRSLLEYIMTSDLYILNQGNEPTFHNVNREEVIDITVGSADMVRSIMDWRVSQVESMSDHRQIHFRYNLGCIKPVTYRNPRKTDWDLYCSILSASIGTRLARIQSVNEIESELVSLQNSVLQAYETACPQRTWKPGGKPVWWTPELKGLRQTVNAAWRRYRAKKSDTGWERYTLAKNKYKGAIRAAKRLSWRAFCESVEGPCASSRLYRLLGRDSANHLSTVSPTGGVPATEINVLRYLFQVHFPGAVEEIRLHDRPSEAASREDWTRAGEIVTTGKVEWAINMFSPFKASGVDGIFPALLQRGMKVLLDPLTRIYRACVTNGYVPLCWRTAKVVFLPKPGKVTYKDAKSFRPISLTSFLLKGLERLVDRHIRDTYLSKVPLSPHQHAYCAGLSTETALHDVVLRVERTLSRGQYAMGCFLDIQGAFDSVLVESIKTALLKRGIDRTTSRWLTTMLQSRAATASLGDSTVTMALKKGCPQGGVISPLCWLLVVDDLLCELNGARLYTQGYADDLVILLEGFCLGTVSELMQRALDRVNRWCGAHGLAVNPHKTELVLFTNKRSKKGLQLPTLGGVQLTLADSVKYLGVVLDHKLNWSKHVTERCHKAVTCLSQCRRIVGPRWGATPRVMMWIYTAVVRPMLSYAASVWWPRVNVGVARAMLTHVQRVACLSITGALRTAPTAALETLLDLSPLDLHILGEATVTAVRLHQAGKWRRLIDARHTLIRDRALVDLPVLSSPSDRVQKVYDFNKNFTTEITAREEWGSTYQVEPSPDCVLCFTDGSLLEGNAGAGMLIQHDRDVWEESFALGVHATVFQTEVYALSRCASLLVDREVRGKQVTIFSDSQAAIRALQQVEVRSALVRDCLLAVNRLGEENNVTVAWVPGHTGVEGNERADQLAKAGSKITFCGPEPVVGVSAAVCRSLTRTWIRRQHLQRWRDRTDCRQARELVEGPKPGVTKRLLSLPRKTVSMLVGVLTGHNTLNRHLSVMRIQQESECLACNEAAETSLHYLGSCPAWWAQRFKHLGSYYLEPKDLRAQRLDSLVSFMKGTGRFK